MPWIRALVSIAAAVIVYLKGGNLPVETAHDLYVLVATLSGTLLGFVLASLSILMAVPDKRLISKMRGSGHYQQLTRELFFTSVNMFVSIVVAICCLFISSAYATLLLSAVIFCFTLSLLFFASVGCKFYLVMEFIGEE